jgi:hypothetical protein
MKKNMIKVDVSSLFWGDKIYPYDPNTVHKVELNPPIEDIEEWLRDNCEKSHSWQETDKEIFLYFHKVDYEVAITFKLMWM